MEAVGPRRVTTDADSGSSGARATSSTSMTASRDGPPVMISGSCVRVEVEPGAYLVSAGGPVPERLPAVVTASPTNQPGIRPLVLADGQERPASRDVRECLTDGPDLLHHAARS